MNEPTASAKLTKGQKPHRPLMKLAKFTTIVAILGLITATFLPPWVWDIDTSLLLSYYSPFTSQSKVPQAFDVIPGGSPIETCETEQSQLISIERISLEPNPPQPGENLTVTASGTVLTTIEAGAYADVVVRYGFITLVNQRYDLCEVLPEVDIECPVEKGYLSLTRVVELPSGVPPGQYYIEAVAYTKDDELLTCLTATVEFGNDSGFVYLSNQPSTP